MLLPSTPQFRKRRGRGKAPTAVPTPPVDGQIVSVSLVEEDPFRWRVTLTAPAAAAELPGAIEILLSDEWMQPDSADLSDPLHPVFTWADAVDLASQWRVPEPGAWTFVGGGTLVAPFQGNVG